MAKILFSIKQKWMIVYIENLQKGPKAISNYNKSSQYDQCSISVLF